MDSVSIASIFRDHGPAWRDAHEGHVSLWQLKVMSAIEQCRNAALGAHAWCCPHCGHTHIAYNSCRNRHCPTCQAVASRQWLEDRQAELLPVEYYHVVFTLPAGELCFHGHLATLCESVAFSQWLQPCRRQDWVVYAKRPFAGPEAVLAYLSRYTHRVAIANRRLLAYDGKTVTFRWKDYRAKGAKRQKTMTLSVDEFIRRFLLHALPRGFHRIRYYGFFANTVRREGLARARAALNVNTANPVTVVEGGHANGNKHSLNAIFPCPHCATTMILFGVVISQASARAPPRTKVA